MLDRKIWSGLDAEWRSGHRDIPNSPAGDGAMALEAGSWLSEGLRCDGSCGTLASTFGRAPLTSGSHQLSGQVVPVGLLIKVETASSSPAPDRPLTKLSASDGDVVTMRPAGKPEL